MPSWSWGAAARIGQDRRWAWDDPSQSSRSPTRPTMPDTSCRGIAADNQHHPAVRGTGRTPRGAVSPPSVLIGHHYWPRAKRRTYHPSPQVPPIQGSASRIGSLAATAQSVLPAPWSNPQSRARAGRIRHFWDGWRMSDAKVRVSFPLRGPVTSGRSHVAGRWRAVPPLNTVYGPHGGLCVCAPPRCRLAHLGGLPPIRCSSVS